MVNKDEIISSYLLYKLISHDNCAVERETLKLRMKSLRDKLSNEGQMVSIDFIKNGNSIYSNKLNELLHFGISANIIKEDMRKGKYYSCIYSLSSVGRDYLQNMPKEYKDVLTSDLIKKSGSLIQKITLDIQQP